MAEFYSRADRARMAQGLDPLPHSDLTPEDYKDLIAFALDEAVGNCPAKNLIASSEVCDLRGKQAGVTKAGIDEDGNLTGRYTIKIDWGYKMNDRASDKTDGKAYVAQRLTSVFHEVRHVEQKAMLIGLLPVEARIDKEIVTQATVNALYPGVYRRGYRNTVTEVDADVSGLGGALAFFDAHPELKTRYGFDFRKEIMRTDEYDVLEDTHQMTEATPEDLLAGMKAYRDGVYGDPWTDKRTSTFSESETGASEAALMEHLRDAYGIGWEDLEAMDNDERNVLLIRNAMEAFDEPGFAIAPNLRSYRDGIVMENRYDEELRDENDLAELVGDRAAQVTGLPEPSWAAFVGTDAGKARGDSGAGRGRTAALRLGTEDLIRTGPVKSGGPERG